MDPATLSALVAMLNAVPNLFLAAQNIRGVLSETDQAALDAALDAAKASALGHISQAVADLDAAAKE